MNRTNRAVLLLGCMLLLAACGRQNAETYPVASFSPSGGGNASSESVEPGFVESRPSESASSISDVPQTAEKWRRDPSLFDVSGLDWGDMDAVTKKCVEPLVLDMLFDSSWESPSEIAPDDLVALCAYDNLLDLPRDWEGTYLPQSFHAPAADVETILAELFNVSADRLRQSRYYDADTETYRLLTGGTGAVSAKAMSVEMRDHTVDIRVGAYALITEEEIEEGERRGEQFPPALKSPHRIITSDGCILVPSGTLTVRVTPQGELRYVSYRLDDGFHWREAAPSNT